MGREVTDPVKVQLPKAYLRLDPNVDQTHPDLEGLIRLMCAANRQPQRGYFKSRQIVDLIIGKGRAKRFVERGDLVDAGDGRLYLDGWTDWQEGDLTVGERQRRIRAKRAGDVTPPLPDRDPPVTPTVTEGVTEALPAPLLDRNAPSEALDVEALDVVDKAPSAVAVAKPRASGPKNEPRLSKEQYDSWRSFTNPKWDRFKLAWLNRGLLYAPFGSPDDDDTSQRGLLWQVVDARPTEAARWVEEAPLPSSREVITYVLEQWHSVRESAGVDDDEWEETKREERHQARDALTHIGDVIPGLHLVQKKPA